MARGSSKPCRPATLKAVAQACGLDVSTVSRALRGEGRISLATAHLAQEAARRLGYRPNLLARRLQAGRTRVVWFLLPTLDNDLERVPAATASRLLAESGFDTLIAVHHGEPPVFCRLLERLAQGVADGALIIPRGGDPRPEERQALETLAGQGFPVVFLDRHPEGMGLATVTSDNAAAVAGLIERCRGAGADFFVNCFEYGGNSVERVRRDAAETALIASGCSWVYGRDLDAVAIAARPPGAVAVIGTGSWDVRPIFSRLPGCIGRHRLLFAVFDHWPGEPFPAVDGFVAIQDFPAMSQLAVGELLAALAAGAMPEPQVHTVPAREIRRVTASFPVG